MSATEPPTPGRYYVPLSAYPPGGPRDCWAGTVGDDGRFALDLTLNDTALYRTPSEAVQAEIDRLTKIRDELIASERAGGGR